MVQSDGSVLGVGHLPTGSRPTRGPLWPAPRPPATRGRTKVGAPMLRRLGSVLLKCIVWDVRDSLHHDVSDLVLVHEAEKIFRWHPESPSCLGCPQELNGHLHLQEVDRSQAYGSERRLGVRAAPRQRGDHCRRARLGRPRAQPRAQVILRGCRTPDQGARRVYSRRQPPAATEEEDVGDCMPSTVRVGWDRYERRPLVSRHGLSIRQIDPSERSAPTIATVPEPHRATDPRAWSTPASAARDRRNRPFVQVDDPRREDRSSSRTLRGWRCRSTRLPTSSTST